MSLIFGKGKKPIHGSENSRHLHRRSVCFSQKGGGMHTGWVRKVTCGLQEGPFSPQKGGEKLKGGKRGKSTEDLRSTICSSFCHERTLLEGGQSTTIQC